jgi:hypothetical protein
MSNIKTGWRRFWSTFNQPLSEVAGFVLAISTWDLITDVLSALVKWGWGQL